MLERTNPALLAVKKRRGQFCYVDRKTRIVMRQRRAVQLGWLEFAIFYALHSRDKGHNKTMNSKELTSVVYSGVINPGGYNAISSAIHFANKKLAHCGIKIVGTNRREHSFYRLVLL